MRVRPGNRILPYIVATGCTVNRKKYLAEEGRGFAEHRVCPAG